MQVSDKQAAMNHLRNQVNEADIPEIRIHSRRDFLRTFVKGGFVTLGLAFGAALLEFSYPGKVQTRPMKFLYAVAEEELPKKGVKRVEISYRKGQSETVYPVFIVNHEGRIFGLSPVCSHLGCLVEWSYPKNEFICPCHGGKYDIAGRVLSGPPPGPLKRLPLQIADGKVYAGLEV